jgi:quinol monooxygenase YgiN
VSQSPEVVVVASLIPSPGQDDAVQTALLEAVAATHEQDRGCRLYAAHRSVRGQEGFVVIEKWDSAEALSEHAAGSAFATLSKQLDGLLAEPLAATVLQPLPAGDERLGRL